MRLTEIKQSLGDLFVYTALFLDLLMYLGYSLIAAKLVFFIRKRLDGLCIGIGKCRRKLRRPGSDRNRNEAGPAHQLHHGTGKGFYELLLGNRRCRKVCTVLLHDLGEDLLGTPL